MIRRRQAACSPARRPLRRLLERAGAGQAGLAARSAFRLAFRRPDRSRGLAPAGLPPAGAPFAEILRRWRLAEQDLPKALAFWRLEALAGFGLCAFALACLAAGLAGGQEAGAVPGTGAGQSQGMIWGLAGMAASLLAHLAKASMALAGLALGLAACWRRTVASGRRFVPFAEWLCFWR